MTIEERIEQIVQFASKCYEDGAKYSAFIVGAIWADRNPVNVWHDASVRPKDNSEILVNWNINEHSGYESYHTCTIENWQKLIKSHGISQWAYISDLLPKGDEK